jgi:serine/threonine protein kinase
MSHAQSPTPVSVDRNLLFGILALQMDFISRDALIQAMNAWVLDKHKPLGQILQEQGALLTENREALDVMIQAHLKMHGNDPQKSLAAISSVSSVRNDLQQVADVDVQASVHHLATLRKDEGELYATRPQTTPPLPLSRFRILRPHAKGGLGQVFIAHDEEVHRQVALKEIQLHHADNPDSRARFVLEAEITGGLEHPGIVPVYGLGHYPDGRPFYAMRFIHGDSLQQAIERFHQADTPGHDPRERNLALRDLLGRFVDVCQAVAYAHSRGVLHRDLKPQNVMLGRFGETLVVDWGLAKALGQSAEEDTEGPLMPSAASDLAPTAQAGGTLPYMSPEQAANRLDRLGTATDVYSLGATLYCLLTGRPPFIDRDASVLVEKVSKGDFTPPRVVKPGVPASLEAICLKAMAVRLEDRYSSPAALAQDVERWLADEPVTAFPDPWSVRARRWLRRRPRLVSGTATALVVATSSLALGLSVVAGKNHALDVANTQLVTANLALDNSNSGLAQANTALQKANAEEAAQRAEAVQARKQAETVSDFLVKSFRNSDPYVESNQLKVVDLLAQAVRELDDNHALEPLTKAKLQDALGTTYLGLGEGKLAIPLFEQSGTAYAIGLGPEHSSTLASRTGLANAYLVAGRTQEAIQLFQQTLELSEKKLGPEHVGTRTCRNNLAEAYRAAGRLQEAIRLNQQTLELTERKVGPEHSDTLTSRNNLAAAYQDAGRLQEAIQLFHQTLNLLEKKLGPEHVSTLACRNNLAEAYRAAGRTQEAIRLNRQTLELKEKKLGPEHPDTLICRNNLAVSYQDAGRTQEAIQLCQQTLNLLEKRLGPEHPFTLTSSNNLANAYQAAGRTQEAIRLNQQTLELKEKKLGPEHPDTLNSRHNLAVAYRAAGRTQEAIQLYQQTLKLREKKLGPEHPETLISRSGLAAAFWSAGQLEQSVPLFEETLRRTIKTLGKTHPDTFRTAFNLGVNYRDAGRLEEAVQVFDDWLARASKVLPADNPAHILGRTVGAETYARAGRPDRAEPLLREAVNLAKRQAGPDSARYGGELTVLGFNLLQQQKWAEAEAALRECLVIRQRLAPDTWTTYNARSMLGGSLLGQKKYAEAEPLLLKGYEGLKAKAKEIPPAGRMRLPQAAERLVRLYEAWGKPSEAARWKKELESLRPPPKAKP